MKNNIILYVALFFASYLTAGCQSKEALINYKNECYQNTLNSLATSTLYRKVVTELNDTLVFIRKDRNFFNDDFENLKVDDAIFLSSDSSQCLAIVLMQDKHDRLVFGEARTFFGRKKKNEWKFRVGLNYTFDADYFQLYPDNDFKHISKLARYNVLTDGRQPKDCGIDEEYWFVEMLKD
jgi:hypothetical protein